MIICVAGPYSAETEEKRKENLSRLNEVAARLLEMGHTPLIGVNAALLVIEKANITDKYKAIMNISMAVTQNCEAIFMVGESPGANRERDAILAKGGKVFYRLDEVAAYDRMPG